VDSDLLVHFDAIETKLNRLLEGSTGTNRRFFSVADAAQHAGLSVESIRRLIAARRLTALRPVRGKILIDRRELETMVLTSTVTPRNWARSGNTTLNDNGHRGKVAAAENSQLQARRPFHD